MNTLVKMSVEVTEDNLLDCLICCPTIQLGDTLTLDHKLDIMGFLNTAETMERIIRLGQISYKSKTNIMIAEQILYRVLKSLRGLKKLDETITD